MKAASHIWLHIFEGIPVNSVWTWVSRSCLFVGSRWHPRYFCVHRACRRGGEGMIVVDAFVPPVAVGIFGRSGVCVVWFSACLSLVAPALARPWFGLACGCVALFDVCGQRRARCAAALLPATLRRKLVRRRCFCAFAWVPSAPGRNRPEAFRYLQETRRPQPG